MPYIFLIFILVAASQLQTSPAQQLKNYRACLSGVNEAAIAAQICVRQTNGASTYCEPEFEAIEAAYDEICPLPRGLR